MSDRKSQISRQHKKIAYVSSSIALWNAKLWDTMEYDGTREVAIRHKYPKSWPLSVRQTPPAHIAEFKLCVDVLITNRFYSIVNSVILLHGTLPLGFMGHWNISPASHYFTATPHCVVRFLPVNDHSAFNANLLSPSKPLIYSSNLPNQVTNRILL